MTQGYGLSGRALYRVTTQQSVSQSFASQRPRSSCMHARGVLHAIYNQPLNLYIPCDSLAVLGAHHRTHNFNARSARILYPPQGNARRTRESLLMRASLAVVVVGKYTLIVVACEKLLTQIRRARCFACAPRNATLPKNAMVHI